MPTSASRKPTKQRAMKILPATADLGGLACLLLDCHDLRSATKFISPTLVVTATRRGKSGVNDSRVEMVLTVGKPNFRGRAFIKACQRAGECFPIRKAQLRWMRGTK